jgi:glutamate-1-semialdehyde 2,1-aminomutase
MSVRYQASEAHLERARSVIPLGAQTFSKSVTQYPLGVSPFFAVRGKGSRLWDVDGNEYLDFVNALCSITIGYADPDITAAVAAQLNDGTIYSLSHPLETAVAERIVAMVPSAEMVRFGKNGSDATSGAVRVARAFTGREHVLACGYHGWHDWYIGATTRDRGVPESTKALTHRFAYNDLDALDAMVRGLDGKVAAIILEPMNIEAPKPGFLEGMRELATRHGIVLVFDETITGFRFAPGGAQELFGVTPDLTTLGKGIANGFPLSAICGRRDIMMEMEEIFFSFTMGGETLSLAAALATLDKISGEPVLATMRARGTRIVEGLRGLIAAHGTGEFCRVSGDPTWSFFSLSDAPTANAFELKTLMLQEFFARGLLTLGTHNMSYAHSDADVDRLLAVYDEVLPVLRDAAQNGALKQHLKCDPLVPLFRVR